MVGPMRAERASPMIRLLIGIAIGLLGTFALGAVNRYLGGTAGTVSVYLGFVTIGLIAGLLLSGLAGLLGAIVGVLASYLSFISSGLSQVPDEGEMAVSLALLGLMLALLAAGYLAGRLLRRVHARAGRAL